MHCPSNKISFSSHSGLHPGVLFSSVAQKSATVTPWAHARHDAVIAKQQNCGFGRQTGQHSPSGVTMIWSSLHSGSKHETALQSTGGFGGGTALQVGQHLPSSVYKNARSLHSKTGQKTSAHFETHSPLTKISSSSHGVPGTTGVVSHGGGSALMHTHVQRPSSKLQSHAISTKG
jgi:hypothetical protein